MSDFDLLFSLFSLLVGLAMAEILSDLGRALDRRKRIRIGWLTPMLAALVLCDLSSFWLSAYEYRHVLHASTLAVFGVLLFASAYYLIATLVVPDDLDNNHDLDAHFYANNRIVVGGIILLNLPNIPLTLISGGLRDLPTQLVVAAFYVVLVGLFVAKSVRANTIMLALAISFYILVPTVLEAIS